MDLEYQISRFHNSGNASNFRGVIIGYSNKTKITYDFSNHFHPYLGYLLEKLSKESLDGLLSHSTQEKRENFFAGIYEPDPNNDNTLTVNYQAKEIDVSETGAYSIYNWELFFHVPFTIAAHLSKNQRFAEAQKWFHYIFDPTSNDQTIDPPMRFWKFKAFREKSAVQLIDDVLKALSSDSEEDKALRERTEKSIEGWRENPFQPHAVARTRFVSYQYNVVMKYLDNLIAWGDSLFRQDSIETINEATQMYVLAANILGEKPQELPRRGNTRPQTFASLRGKIDAFGNALVEMEGQFPFNLNLPRTEGVDHDRSQTLFGLGQTLYFCIPENPKLLGYWDLVADRLFKIRNCMNIEGIVRQLPLFQPPIDPGMLVKAAASGIDISSVVGGLNQPLSPIRSSLLLQKALELCGEVRSLGANLLSAIEKQDGEALALLRQQQEIHMIELSRDVRLMQWKESEANTDALLSSRDMIYQRYQHYQMLLGKPEEEYTALSALEAERRSLLEGSDHDDVKSNIDTIYSELIDKYSEEIELAGYTNSSHNDEGLHLNDKENTELNTLSPIIATMKGAAGALELIAGPMMIIPDVKVNAHFWGVGATIEPPAGSKLSDFSRIAASVLNTAASVTQDISNNVAKSASYERRAQDWTLQSNLAAKELMQVGKQIVASLIREQVTKKEYENQQQQLDYSLEIDAFLKDKFTNEQLYKWMSGELSKVYYDYYKFAFDIAKQAEQTMKWELMRPEIDKRSFIKFNYWDAGRKGLLSGESLHLDLKRMEMAYHEANKREFELTKHISLRQLNPYALLELKTTGTCTVNIPEWLFDLDGPGHFMRRIKSIAVSIPAIAGPYTSVNCTLSLQRSSIRKSAILGDDYARQEEDDRFVDYFGTIQSIVTSNAQNDSGLFEVNLRDERFLPFENAGAVSTWRLELPAELRQFDYSTITDVILHMRYTARQGGGQLASAATKYIKEEILVSANESGFVRLFSLKHDFPMAWHRFDQAEEGNFEVEISRDQFPYLAQLGEIVLPEGNDQPMPFELWVADEQELNPLALTRADINEDGNIDGNLLAHTLENLNQDERKGALVIRKGLLEDPSDVFLLVRYAIEI